MTGSFFGFGFIALGVAVPFAVEGLAVRVPFFTSLTVPFFILVPFLVVAGAVVSMVLSAAAGFTSLAVVGFLPMVLVAAGFATGVSLVTCFFSFSILVMSVLSWAFTV